MNVLGKNQRTDRRLLLKDRLYLGRKNETLTKEEGSENEEDYKALKVRKAWKAHKGWWHGSDGVRLHKDVGFSWKVEGRRFKSSKLNE